MKTGRQVKIFTIVLAAAMTFAPLCVAAAAGDRDNNPPGPKGGEGTNWENPPGPKGGPGASPDQKDGHWKKTADSNKDGVVDEAEREAAKVKKAEMRAGWMGKADTNRDGIVDETEKQAAIDRWKETHKEEHKEKWLTKADSDGDGALSEAEREAAKIKHAAWKEKADRNNDGKVGPHERKLARKERRDQSD